MGRFNLGIVTLLALGILTLLARPVVAQPPYSAAPPVTHQIPEEVAPADVPGEAPAPYEEYWTEDGWPVDGPEMDYYHEPLQSQCDVCSTYPCSCHGVWTFDAEVLIMQRQSSRNTLLSFEFNNVPQQVDRMTTKELKFGIEPGFRFAGRRYLGSDLEQRDYTFEVIFFGLLEWNAERQVSGSRFTDGNGVTRGLLFTPFLLSSFPVGGFDNADIHRSSYSSNLNNVEWNLRIGPPLRRERRVFTPGRGWTQQRGVGMSQSLFGGLRLMTIHEDFGFFADTRVDVNSIFLGNKSAAYRVKTRNRLVGVQMGGELVERQTRWQWGMSGKAGAFVNMGEQLTGIISDDIADPLVFTQTPGHFVNDGEERVAFVAEAGIFGVYRIRPAIALRAGYQVMWLGGLALASEQLDFDFRQPIVINQRGRIFYQGASLGLEASW